MTSDSPAAEYLALAATIHQETLFVQHQTTTTQWDGQIHNHRTGTK